MFFFFHILSIGILTSASAFPEEKDKLNHNNRESSYSTPTKANLEVHMKIRWSASSVCLLSQKFLSWRDSPAGNRLKDYEDVNE